MKAAPLSHAKSFARLGELVKEIEIAMLSTATEDGTVRSRPMATQHVDLIEGSIWFFTSHDSPKIDEIFHKQQVNLAYASTGKQRFVSVSGRAHIVRDQAKARELWRPSAKIWFPQGVDDPNLVLLRVDVTSAEYWDAPSSRMVQLYGLARLAVTGKTNPASGENVKVEITSQNS